MPISDNTPKLSEKFDDVWQEILPGLEPLPPQVRNIDDINKKHVPHIQGGLEEKTDCVGDMTCFLRARIEQECSIHRFYQALIKKSPQRTAQAMMELARAQKQVLAGLMALYFLKTGEKSACGKACPYISSVPHAIRNLCNDEAHSGNIYKKAAGQTDDERFISVFGEIVEIKIRNSKALIRLLGPLIHHQ